MKGPIGRKLITLNRFTPFFYEHVLLHIYVNEKVVFNGMNPITTQAVECVPFCSKTASKNYKIVFLISFLSPTYCKLFVACNPFGIGDNYF